MKLPVTILWWASAVFADLFTNDGILVEHVDNAKTIIGYWDVLVVLHEPIRPDITEWRNTLLEIIDNNTTDSISLDEKMLWEAKINRLHWSRQLQLSNNDLPEEPVLIPTTTSAPRPTPGRQGRWKQNRWNHSRRRQRRGLLNLIGKLSQTLFGTATDSEVQDIKRVLKEMSVTDESLYHNQEKMMSVFNQSRHFIEQNTLGIQSLFQEMGTLKQLSLYNANITKTLAHDIRDLALMRHIDNSINEMEEVYADFGLKWQLWHRQRIQLEGDQLTEDVLPPSQLQGILHKIQEMNFGCLPVTWYYMNLGIHQINLNEPSRLVFKVRVPILSLEEFIHYKINYFPVPLQDELHSRTVLGRSDVVIETSTGDWFDPQNSLCVGKSPTVCQVDRLFLKRSCENDLIEGREGTCRVQISDIINKTLAVYHDSVYSNEVIMVAFKESTVQIRCLGQTAQSISFKGPYKISLPVNCTLLTPEWRIDAMRHYRTNVNVKFHKYINLPPINFSWPNRLPHDLQIKLSPQTPLTLNWDQLPHLKTPTHWSFRVNSWWDSYGLLVTCGLIGTLILLALLIFMWKSKCLPTVLPCNKPRDFHTPKGSIPKDMEEKVQLNPSSVNKSSPFATESVEMKDMSLYPLDKLKYFDASNASFTPMINFVEPSAPSNR